MFHRLIEMSHVWLGWVVLGLLALIVAALVWTAVLLIRSGFEDSRRAAEDRRRRT